MYIHLPILVQLMVNPGLQEPLKPVQGQIEPGLIAVKGVSIGSTKSDVIQKLGKPHKSHTGIDEIMGMGKWEKMEFPGLVVEATQPDPPAGKKVKPAYVWRMVIRSRQWQTKSNLRVGDSIEQVIKFLGNPASEDSKGSIKVLNYFPRGFDGFLWVKLDSGVVSEIGIAEDWT